MLKKSCAVVDELKSESNNSLKKLVLVQDKLTSGTNPPSSPVITDRLAYSSTLTQQACNKSPPASLEDVKKVVKEVLNDVWA